MFFFQRVWSLTWISCKVPKKFNDRHYEARDASFWGNSWDLASATTPSLFLHFAKNNNLYCARFALLSQRLKFMDSSASEQPSWGSLNYCARIICISTQRDIDPFQIDDSIWKHVYVADFQIYWKILMIGKNEFNIINTRFQREGGLVYILYTIYLIYNIYIYMFNNWHKYLAELIKINSLCLRETELFIFLGEAIILYPFYNSIQQELLANFPSHSFLLPPRHWFALSRLSKDTVLPIHLATHQSRSSLLQWKTSPLKARRYLQRLLNYAARRDTRYRVKTA